MAQGGGEQNTTGGTLSVFISYASQDGALADAIVGALEHAGLRCWIAPRNVVPGSRYAEEIVGAINDAGAVVLVLSEHAIASPHVGKEIERASSKGRPIFALRTDSAPLTKAFEYFLSESQWIDVRSGDIEAAAVKLVQAIRRHFDPSAAAAEPYSLADQPMAGRALTVARTNWMIVGVVAVVGLVFAYLIVDKYWRAKNPARERTVAATPATALAAPGISEKSVAVLPFVDMSEKKDQEYLSDGLSEELIDRLSKVADLRVPARTSSFYFKGRQSTISEIAKALNVAHVLEGSVRKSGNKLRITAQLIRTDNGYHVWSETYDRKIDDVFKIQDGIAAAVVRSLQASLHSSMPSTSGTQNTESYTLYLQAQSIVRRGNNKAEREKAREYVMRVLKLDANFPAGWALLSSILKLQADRHDVGGPEIREGARRAALHALTLDPNLAIAHTALADLQMTWDWDWDGAETHIQKARVLDPNNPDVLDSAALLDLRRGRVADAIRLSELAVAFDPVNPDHYPTLGSAYVFAGRSNEALNTFRRFLDLNPGALWAHSWVADILLLKGEPAAALGEYGQADDEQALQSGRALAYYGLRRQAEANSILVQYERDHSSDDAYGIAEIHAYRREAAQSFKWLDRAFAQRDGRISFVKVSPFFKDIRSDPRFLELLRKLRLSEADVSQSTDSS
jgi:TolB-like protein/Flp pilus assembly protein TadD